MGWGGVGWGGVGEHGAAAAAQLAKASPYRFLLSFRLRSRKPLHF